MSVKYINDHMNFEVVRTRQTPVNRSRTGYGRKLPTQWMVYDRDSKIYRRVYAICCSNAASHYITVKGEMLFLRGCDVPENPRAIGVPDDRYSVTMEWCGDVERKHVLRFCGAWISKHETREDAETAAEAYHIKRSGR